MSMEKIKEKARNLKDSVKEKAVAAKEKAGQFFDEHEDVMGALITFGFTALPGIVAVVGGIIGKNAEGSYVEDDVTGLEFRTKHNLTNKEILELGDRMIDGQTKGDALNEMGLLKKEKKRR